MINTVLIGLDGSPASQSVLETTRDMLAGKDIAVTVLHVLQRPVVFGKAGAMPAQLHDPQADRAAAEAMLDESIRHLREGGVGPDISRRIEVGDPADVILTVAVDSDADLIIVGRRGLSSASRFLMGSVSTKIVLHANCPVLVGHAG